MLAAVESQDHCAAMSIRNASILLEYTRRGWIGVPLYLPGRAYAADKEVLQRNGDLRAADHANGHKPDKSSSGDPMPAQLIEARRRIAAVRATIPLAMLPLLDAVAGDAEHPGAWAEANGLQPRYGILLLRSCLREIAAVYPGR